MLASALVVARSVPAQAASLASLTVNPTHGAPTDKFTATYQITPCQSAAGQAVSFYWDGVPPSGGKSLGQAFTDATCAATLAAIPPTGTAVGNHTVWAFLPLNDGSPIIGTSASHGYMVDNPAPATQPASGGSAGTVSGSGGSGQTVTAGGGGTTSRGSGGATTTSGGVGAGGSQGSGASGAGGGGNGTNQTSGNGGGGAFGPAPHIMTPLGLVSQAFIGWSLLLLIILLALLLAVGYSQRDRRPSVRSTYP
jgi:hypothetical protein